MSKKGFGNELHPLYYTWLTIKQRCDNPKHASYKNYGARGITRAEEFSDFKVFAAYLESLDGYADRERLGLTLDRIDGSLEYIPVNLRWATRTTQAINSRKRRTSKATYLGIGLNTTKKKWSARICSGNERIFVGNFDSEIEALEARNACIIEHGLPHAIQKIK